MITGLCSELLMHVLILYALTIRVLRVLLNCEKGEHFIITDPNVFLFHKINAKPK